MAVSVLASIAGFPTGAGGPIDTLVDRLVPDSGAKAERAHEIATARLEIEKAFYEFAAQQNLGQLEVNRVEAAHQSIFVAGLRPRIGLAVGRSMRTPVPPS